MNTYFKNKNNKTRSWSEFTRPFIPRFVKRLFSCSNKRIKNVMDNLIEEKNRALEVRDEFLRNISHEVRTPLTGITSMANYVYENWHNMDNKKQALALELLAKSSQRMLSMMSNILDLSKYTTGKETYHLQNARIGEIIEIIIESELKLYTQDKKQHFTFTFDDSSGDLILKVDQDKITQIIRHFYINAINFMEMSGRSGRIDAKLNQTDNYLLFTLSDQGPGIDENELEEIFTPFYQGLRTKDGGGGTGIGLAICKNIAELHNGKVWAEQNKSGIGATFFLELPIDLSMKLRPSFAIEAPFEQFLVKSTQGDKIDNASGKQDSTVASANGRLHKSSQDRIPKKVVVVIDDESIILSAISLMLGYRKDLDLKYFADGMNAKEFIQDNNVDLILLDWMMPNINGLQILEWVRSDNSLEHTRIIVQSAISEEDVRKEARDLKIDGFLAKPYTQVRVEDAIDYQLSLRKISPSKKTA